MTLLIEEAISHETVIDQTPHFSPTGAEYKHLKLRQPETKMCAVSILRAGDSMLDPVMHLLPDITVGKILIQRNEKAEPEFLYCKLPTDIASAERVLLVDPMLATGGSASVAIQKIVEAGVSPSNITFVNLVSCEDGIARLQHDHPEVLILTATVDPILNEKKYIIPGLGDYGDRFFRSTG